MRYRKQPLERHRYLRCFPHIPGHSPRFRSAAAEGGRLERVVRPEIIVTTTRDPHFPGSRSRTYPFLESPAGGAQPKRPALMPHLTLLRCRQRTRPGPRLRASDRSPSERWQRSASTSRTTTARPLIAIGDSPSMWSSRCVMTPGKRAPCSRERKHTNTGASPTLPQWKARRGNNSPHAGGSGTASANALRRIHRGNGQRFARTRQ